MRRVVGVASKGYMLSEVMEWAWALVVALVIVSRGLLGLLVSLVLADKSHRRMAVSAPPEMR